MSQDNSILYKSAKGYQKVLEQYDATFEKMGISRHIRYVETSFGPTHTVICGNEKGKSLALWHGLNTNSTSWVNWIPSLVQTYCIYCIDTIGGMGKSAPNRPSKKGPAYGQWATEVLRGLGLTQSNMIGVSNGGWLIMKLGSVSPEMISSAVLLSSAGFAPANIGLIFRMIPRISFKPPAEAARRLLDMLSPPGLPPDPLFLSLFELTISTQFRAEQLAPVIGDIELRQLAAPTYILMGQYEVSFNPYKAIRRGLRIIPNVVSAEIVPGVGHAMVHKQADWVTARVLSFLEKYAK